MVGPWLSAMGKHLALPPGGRLMFCDQPFQGGIHLSADQRTLIFKTKKQS